MQYLIPIESFFENVYQFLQQTIFMEKNDNFNFFTSKFSLFIFETFTNLKKKMTKTKYSELVTHA